MFGTIASFVLLEVFFLSSKPSWFSGMSILERIELVNNSLFILFTASLILWLGLFSIALLLSEQKKVRDGLLWCCWLLVSLFFVAVILTNLETVIYTLTEWSVYDLSGLNNAILLVLLVNLAVLLVLRRRVQVSRFFSSYGWKMPSVVLLLFLATFPLVLKKVGFAAPAQGSLGESSMADAPGYRPNIVLFSADGLDTRYLGVYGYEKETTPNLSKLRNLIIYTRAYCNGGDTRSSTVSILTGKNPLTTGVIDGTRILREEDAFHHLPHILASAGYFCIDLNDGIMASSSKGNLREGFHFENFSGTGYEVGLNPLEKQWARLHGRVPSYFSNVITRRLGIELYFLKELIERNSNKILFMADLTKTAWILLPTDLDTATTGIKDRLLIGRFKELITETEQPFFVHLHLMSTHSLRAVTMSAEQGKSVQDVYDQLVSTVDGYLGEIIEILEKNDKFDDTLIVFHTDHGLTYQFKHIISSLGELTGYPLPLVVHLPGQKERIIIEESVQYLDIAPSILAFLGIPIPDWMEGNVIFTRSINELRIPRSRPLIAATSLIALDRSDKSHRNNDAPNEVVAVRMVLGDMCYTYLAGSASGSLHDLSRSAYDFKEIRQPELVQHYHEILCKELEKKETSVSCPQ